jgi:dTMP kinase
MIKNRGIFVSIDGPNGVGKTTLIAAVGKRLREIGMSVHLTKEVTDTDIGRFIRQFHKQYRAKTLAFLLAADRQNHIETDILPALINHDIVITDRYVDSSFAFQKMDGVEAAFLWKINQEFIRPVLSISVTASIEAIESRMATRMVLDRFEETFKRETEIKHFQEAATFLGNNGFNVLRFDNTVVTVEDAAETLSNAILQCRQNATK